MTVSAPNRSESLDSRSTVSPAHAQVRVTEIFRSIQGESTRAGLTTSFVRLTGCPLRCQYCDTTYAFNGGTKYPVSEVVQRVLKLDTPTVCVTGGEPLAQPGALELLRQLSDHGLSVSLETSGAMDIRAVDPRVSRIVDVKTPGSGEQHRNRFENFGFLNQSDELKFVICSRSDFEWAIALMSDHALSDRCPVLFSPSASQVNAAQLADWILKEKLPVRLQLQMHKLLWGDSPGR